MITTDTELTMRGICHGIAEDVAMNNVISAARRLTAFNPDDTVDTWRFVDAWDELKSALADLVEVQKK